MAFQGEKQREPSGWANSATADRGVLPVFRLGPVAKRMVDIAAATLGLLVFSPILLIASIAIKLEISRPRSHPRDAVWVQEPTNPIA